MDPENLDVQTRLLGEAFPDDFFVCIVFKRDELGNLAKTFDILTRPRTQQEVKLTKYIADFVRNAG